MLLSEVRPDVLPSSDLENCVWQFPVKPGKIYVAAPVTNQARALQVAVGLMRRGYAVTSRWLEFDFSTARTPDQDWPNYVKRSETWGQRDLEDLEAADTLVVLSDRPSTSGGYHVEVGFFIGRGRENIVVVGGRPNVFFWSKTIQYLSSLTDLVDFLKDPGHGNLHRPAKGERNDSLFKLGTRLRGLGFDADELFEALASVNAHRHSPPLSKDEVGAISYSIMKSSGFEGGGHF